MQIIVCHILDSMQYLIDYWLRTFLGLATDLNKLIIFVSINHLINWNAEE